MTTQYKVSENPIKGKCHITDDNVACEKKVYIRGLCHTHYSLFYKLGVVDKYALVCHARSKNKALLTKENVTVNQKAKDGMCPFVESGEVCTNVIVSMGLCLQHRYRLSSCEDLLEMFAVPRKLKKVEKFRKSHFKISKNVQAATCRIVERGVSCDRKISSRQMCSHHRYYFKKHGKLEDYAAALYARATNRKS